MVKLKASTCLPSIFKGAIILLVSMATVFAAGGKIAGKVIDAQTRESLPGADVIIRNLGLGAATSQYGEYFILNVRPGVYEVECRMIGYGIIRKEHIMVSSNRTTVLSFELSLEAIQGQIVIVDAERSMIQTSVSSSQRIISAAEITSRPLDNMEEIISSEAGISLSTSDEGSGISVRGGNINEVNILVDGVTTRNARNQQPNTNFNLTAITITDMPKYYDHLPTSLIPIFYATVTNHSFTQLALEYLRQEQVDYQKIGMILNDHHERLRDYLQLTVPKINQMVNLALQAGALGVKINGSGGGGTIAILAPGCEDRVCAALESIGAEAYRVNVDPGARYID